MAALQYSPACRCGSPLKVFASSGRVAHQCRECRLRKTPRPNDCAKCGEAFERSANHQRFCSDQCNQAFHRPKCAEPRLGKQPRGCKGCGAVFIPKTNRRGSYCSRACAFSNLRQWHPGRTDWHGVGRHCKVWFRDCVECGSAFTGRREKQTTCSKECRLALACSRSKRYQPRLPKRKQCVTCGLWFEKKWANKHCSKKCARFEWRISGHTYTKRRYALSGREWQRMRLMVLKRDRYLCHLCERPTDPAASPNDDIYPNADHVIPVSKGGETRIGNLRCAHRMCNMKKSDKQAATAASH